MREERKRLIWLDRRGLSPPAGCSHRLAGRPRILFVIGGFEGQFWVALLGIVVMFGFAWLSRRFIQQVEDPPPIFGYLDKRSLNPLVTMRHPIRETRLGLEVFKVRRNRREHREWQERRGLR